MNKINDFKVCFSNKELNTEIKGEASWYIYKDKVYVNMYTVEENFRGQLTIPILNSKLEEERELIIKVYSKIYDGWCTIISDVIIKCIKTKLKIVLTTKLNNSDAWVETTIPNNLFI